MPERRVAKALKEAAHRMLPVELRGNEQEVGHLPYQVLETRGPTRLLYYAPAEDAPAQKTPVLLVYSLINRYYVLDFMPGRSLIGYLTSQGHPCYVFDWGIPTIADRFKTWGDYTIGYLGGAVRRVCDHAGVARVTLYGYCMGGTLALAYAALRPERIGALVMMAVPVDFHDEGLLSLWTRRQYFNVDALVDAYGNVPTWLMESGFRLLVPVSNVSKFRDLWSNRDKEGFVDTWRSMEAWSADNVAFPGEVYRQYIRDCYQTNAFFKGEMVVYGEKVDLSNIDQPLCLVVASRDHIVPMPSALALLDRTSSDDREVIELQTGHIGLSTSSRGPKTFWPQISDWMKRHDHQAGAGGHLRVAGS